MCSWVEGGRDSSNSSIGAAISVTIGATILSTIGAALSVPIGAAISLSIGVAMSVAKKASVSVTVGVIRVVLRTNAGPERFLTLSGSVSRGLFRDLVL
jgi:hypothetical protein